MSRGHVTIGTCSRIIGYELTTMVSGLPMMVSGPPTVVCVPIYGHWAMA